MPITAVTNETFDSVLSENEYVLVVFWAEWCQPCLQFNEVLVQLSETIPELMIAKVDIQAEKTLADDFQVKSVPRFLLVRAKVILCDEAGIVPLSSLIDLIEQAQKITDADLTKLREHVESTED